jgi:transposase-like protein
MERVVLGTPRKKFTKEFKQAVALRVQEGAPVKEVARAYEVHPSAVRE